MHQFKIKLFLELLCKKVAVGGSIELFGSWRKTGQKCPIFSLNFCVTQLECVITKISRSKKFQPAMLCMLCLFLKNKAKRG